MSVDWGVVLNLVAVVVTIGLFVGLIYLIYRGVKLATGCLFALFGLAAALALWLDAVNGWPILSRIAWLFYQMIAALYSSTDQATSGIPALPNPFD